MANQPSKYSKFLVGAASAALVASAVVPVASAADFSDIKGNTHEDSINALVKAGVISGYPDGSFLPNKTLSRSDVVKMMGKLLVSLGKEVPTDYKTVQRFDDLPLTANEELVKYAALTFDAGVFKGSNGKLNAAGDITRENMALVLVRAYDAINKTDLVAHVKAQEFKKDVTDLATAKEEARAAIDVLDFYDITNPVAPKFNPKATTTRGQFASFLFKTTEVEAPAAPVTTATKVETVTATNLKEVEVKFDGTVDEDTATDKANYSLKSGKTIKNVAFSADKNAVTITLADGTTLANNKTEALTVSNVEAGDIKINEKNIEFKVADNKLPEVSEIKSLGTKSVKVAFSEPVTGLQQSNFTLDGKAFFGKIDMGAGNKSAILTPFSTSALAVGDHSLTVSAVKDFAGFISLNSTHDFTVVEDLVAPTITEATATLESVTITFSEDVDASTVSSSKVYWKSGDSKKTAFGEAEQLADNKFKFHFSTSNPDNSLPTGKVDIYVEDVKDYSANQIAKDTKVTVTPEIDQTRPEVRKVVATSATEFKVTFSKAIDATSAGLEGNYTVTNSAGKVISVKEAIIDADGKSVNVELYSSLSVGENTITVKNVKDATKLKNTMVDYSGKIVRADVTGPTIESKAINEDQKRVVFKFDKKMDVESLVDYSNYLVKVNNQLQTLTPDMADISVTQDGSAVIITFAETINGKKVKFEKNTAAVVASGEVNLNMIQVLGLKDASGNLLKDFAAGTNIHDLEKTVLAVDEFDTAKPGMVAKFVDSKTVELYFNAGVNTAPKEAFTAAGHVVDYVVVDGTSKVTVKFKGDINTDASAFSLGVNYNLLVDIAGNVVTGAGPATIAAGSNLLDQVAPVVNNPSVPYANVGVDKVLITYSEALQQIAGAGQELLDKDFTIVRVSDNKTLNPNGDYDVTVGTGTVGAGGVISGNGIVENTLQITFTDGSAVQTAYKVTVNNAQYVTDKSGNKVANSAGQSVQLVAAAGAPLLTGVTFTDVTGPTNNGKSVFNQAAPGIYKYLKSSTAVSTPAVGADVSSWTTVVNGDEITVTNNQNVGVAEVTAAGKVIRFVNVLAANADYLAATPAVVTAASASVLTTDLTGKTASIVVNVDGITAGNTFAASLATWDGTGNAAALAAAIGAASNGSVALSTVADVTVVGGVITITAKSTGIASTVAVTLTGADSADAITLTGFAGTETDAGANASN